MSKIPVTPDIVGESLCIFCSYRCNKGIIAEKPKITFNCPYCCSVFSNKSAVSQHVMTHSKERPLKCARCEFRTSIKRRLVEHMKAKHLLCASCYPFRAFVTKARFEIHWQICHEIEKKEHLNKNFNKSTTETTTKSGVNFENKIDAIEQLPGTVVGTNQPHEQKVVNRDNNFSAVNTVQELPSTSENDDMNLCKLCNYNCNRTKINRKYAIFGCFYCCSRFHQSKERLDHIKTTHTKERPYKCEDCDFRTENPFYLEAHHLRQRHMKGYLSHKAFLKNKDSSPGTIVGTNQFHEQKVVNRDNNFTAVNTVQELPSTSENFNNPTAETATKSGENFKMDVAQKPPGSIVGTNQSHEQKVDNWNNNFTSVNTVQEQPSTSENDDMNLCTLCNYNCNRGIVVYDYPEVNSKSSMFHCRHCCSRFLQKNEMQDHINKTHTKEAPYKCEDCDFRTKNPHHLGAHHLRENHMKGYLSHKAFLKNGIVNRAGQ